MKIITKKSVAVFLVIVLLFMLCPVFDAHVVAAENTNTDSPILNKLVVGNLQFQAFNFLGENSTGNGRNDYSDGKDYTSTFYYTDDYFSPSAINENATQTTMQWSDLDNTSLAACSAAFAFASFTSNTGNVTSNTKYSGKGSWENTDYANKDSNVKSFLSQCGFDDVVAYGMTEKPTIFSIANTIASKQITVWDEESQTNKTYTLVAVGVRGAGYDSEWADNVTIGNPNTSSHEMPNGRHWGFDNSANTVCGNIRNYLNEKHISGDVKYWVTGFSRAAAVANLVSGYLTDDPETYHTSGRLSEGSPDVYGYTWECPQAAKKLSNDANALQYKNIHNILNPMDAVPKVSPDEFGHQRLGVDYQMPYYGNTNNSKALNKSYYERMQAVLSTIATAKQADGSNDPVVTAVANYPYNDPVPVYTITGLKLISDAIGGNLAKNFGTEAVSARDNKIGTVYMDQFIDNLIDVFLTSKAWSGGTGQGASPSANMQTFINSYQEDFRVLLGYLLDFSGPAFLGMMNEMMDAVGDQIATVNPLKLWNNTGFAFAFAGFYFFNLGKDNLITKSQDMAVNIVNDMTVDYPDSANGSGITRARMNSALKNAVKLVINLYAQEKNAYDSQYFGTSLHLLNEILCTHLQETVLSWIMSLDENHMNRSCRTVKIPIDSSAKMFEFREAYAQYDGNPEDVIATAPVVASWEDGSWNSLDDRITYTVSGDYLYVRYPSSLEIRTDITSSGSLPLSSVSLDDYMTTSETVNVSAGKAQFSSQLPSNGNSDSSGYRYITTNSSLTNANNANQDLSDYGNLEPGEVLHIIVNGTDKYNDASNYNLIIDKTPKNVVVEYSMPTILAEGVSQDMLPADADGFSVKDGNLVWTGKIETENNKVYENTFGTTREFTEYHLSDLSETRSVRAERLAGSIKTRQEMTVMPTGNIYYDDDLLSKTAVVNDGTQDYKVNVETSLPDEIISTAEDKFSFRFTGTRIDVYMNTDSSTGTVGAYLLNEDATALYRQDGKTYSKIINGKSENTLYNVPVVSFSGLNRGTYTLVLVPNKGQSVRIDGLRVYDEGKALYSSVRESLLETSDWTGEGTVNGVVYLDFEKNEHATQEDYRGSGPKGEVYLQNGNGIAFVIDNFNASASYRIGLGAVTGTPVTVQINGETPFTVSARTHMFYDLHPTSNGEVVIRNTGGGILSVTDIEKTSVDRTSEMEPLQLKSTPALMRFASSIKAVSVDTDETEESPELEGSEERTGQSEEPADSESTEQEQEPTSDEMPSDNTTQNKDGGNRFIRFLTSVVKTITKSFLRFFR